MQTTVGPTPKEFFAGMTLADQRRFEEERGWKPDQIGPNTYSTTEVVIFHIPVNTEDFWDWEILDAERVTGAPDCVGRRQGKWGTQVRPRTDGSAKEAILRGIRELFGKDFPGELRFVGVIGPWLHRARTDGEKLFIDEEKGEETPFQAPYYAFISERKEFDPSAGHSKSMRDVRWITLRDLIAERGQDSSYLYWQMISRAVSHLYSTNRSDCEPRYYAPGEYPFIE